MYMNWLTTITRIKEKSVGTNPEYSWHLLKASFGSFSYATSNEVNWSIQDPTLPYLPNKEYRHSELFS